MEDKFRVLILIKGIISDYDNLLLTSKIKDNILTEVYTVLKLSYIANDTYNKVKKYNMQVEILSRLKYVIYLTNKLSIDNKKMDMFNYKLELIIKHIKSWIKVTK